MGLWRPCGGLLAPLGPPGPLQGRSGTAPGPLLGRPWGFFGPPWGNLGPTWSQRGPQDGLQEAPRAPLGSHVLLCRMETRKSVPKKVKNDSFATTDSVRCQAPCAWFSAQLNSLCLETDVCKKSISPWFLRYFWRLRLCGQHPRQSRREANMSPERGPEAKKTAASGATRPEG